MEAIRCTLPSLITSLEREASERGDPTALGLATLVKSYTFVATLLLMSDALAQLDKLSLIFQERDIDLSRVQPLVSACIKVIQGMRKSPGPALQGLTAVLQSPTDNDICIKTKDGEEQTFHCEVQEKYSDSLVANLTDRFPD